MDDTPRFYFTVHPGDLSRKRLPQGCHVMLVASAHWDDARKRFRIRRPPTDHIASVAVDCGGFTAARRWGRYPWEPAQYAEFARAVSRDLALDFVALMDYACERGVDRSTYETNIERIDATIANEIACRQADPALPWLPVLQGDTLEERRYDLDRRSELGMLPAARDPQAEGWSVQAGIGSICGRGARAAREVVRFYDGALPGTKVHVFGAHVGVLDDDVAAGALASWDSYSWSWARGARSDRAPDYLKRADESYGAYARRLARMYIDNTVAPRLSRPRTRPLW